MRSSNASRRNRGRSNGRSNGRRHGIGNSHLHENNSPESKIKGNALQVHEKYLVLARDAKSSGDSIKSENFLQHAEHYHRVHLSIQQANQQKTYSKEKEEKQKNVFLINKDESKKSSKSAIKITEKDKTLTQENKTITPSKK